VVEPSPGVLIVTGASRGIGAAIARLGARRGYGVCVNYNISAQAAEAVVADIVDNGGRAIAVAADVTKESDVKRLFDTVERDLGPVTALVNNAGTPGKRERFSDLDVETLQSVFSVNVLAVALCSREAVRRMSFANGKNGGDIVNISSQVTKTGGMNLVAYAASKGAVNTFTLSLAREVSGEGIRVNAVSPGIIETEQQPLDDQEWVQRVSATIPLGRMGKPEEVANMVLWLLSSEASYVTGEVFPVAGGRSYQ